MERSVAARIFSIGITPVLQEQSDQLVAPAHHRVVQGRSAPSARREKVAMTINVHSSLQILPRQIRIAELASHVKIRLPVLVCNSHRARCPGIQEQLQQIQQQAPSRFDLAKTVLLLPFQQLVNMYRRVAVRVFHPHVSAVRSDEFYQKPNAEFGEGHILNEEMQSRVTRPHRRVRMDGAVNVTAAFQRTSDLTDRSSHASQMELGQPDRIVHDVPVRISRGHDDSDDFSPPVFVAAEVTFGQNLQQRGQALGVPSANVGSPFDQHLDHFQALTLHGEMQPRVPGATSPKVALSLARATFAAAVNNRHSGVHVSFQL